MFPEDAESLEWSFWLCSLLFPLPLQNLSSLAASVTRAAWTRSQRRGGRGEPSWRLEGAALPGCQLVGQPEEAPSALSLLLPGMEVRDGGCTGMTGCGKRGGKKPPGEGLQLALLELWGTSASLQWEMQRGKAVQICGGKSELQGYISPYLGVGVK